MSGGLGLLDGRAATATQTKPIVCACVAEFDQRIRIADALRDRAVVRFALDAADLRTLVLTDISEIGAVIVSPTDASGGSTLAAIREIAHARPGTPIVGYCRAGLEHSAHIRGLAI